LVPGVQNLYGSEHQTTGAHESRSAKRVMLGTASFLGNAAYAGFSFCLLFFLVRASQVFEALYSATEFSA
jgi:hypothetical protein